MIIDFRDGRERHEFLCDLQPLITGYIRRRSAPYLHGLSPGEQMSELGPIYDYLRDHLIIEWKGGTGYVPEPDDEDGYEYNRE